MPRSGGRPIVDRFKNEGLVGEKKIVHVTAISPTLKNRKRRAELDVDSKKLSVPIRLPTAEGAEGQTDYVIELDADRDRVVGQTDGAGAQMTVQLKIVKGKKEEFIKEENCFGPDNTAVRYRGFKHGRCGRYSHLPFCPQRQPQKNSSVPHPERGSCICKHVPTEREYNPEPPWRIPNHTRAHSEGIPRLPWTCPSGPFREKGRQQTDNRCGPALFCRLRNTHGHKSP